MDVRLFGHTAYRTECHIVWIPKYRHRILNHGVKGYLVKLFPKVMEQLLGCEIIKCNVQPTIYT
jgi:REP element-mobilizing transposase RayT